MSTTTNVTDQSVWQNCVVRDVFGTKEYVPLDLAGTLIAGEKVYNGLFMTETVKDKASPSHSNRQNVCTPAGRIEVTHYPSVIKQAA